MPNQPKPTLHPGTKEPISAHDLSGLFPSEIVKQELSSERFIPIPDAVRDLYLMYRPSPLVRADRLEKAIGTPARIYYKYEGCSPSGSHKTNTALAQAYYNKLDGIENLTTETGAGQWGSALSFACKQFGLNLTVFMVNSSFIAKPYRKIYINTMGSRVISSPSMETESGRKILEQFPETQGSLGIAISEAIEMAVKSENTNYALGSVLNHVILHQTIIGQEAILQLEKAEVEADIVIGCFGGGSNFGGMTFPFLRQNFKNNKKIRCIAVEPSSCPKLTKGEFRYDFGDTTGLTPLIPMYTLGNDFAPPAIHAGGLRYHGAGALASQLLHDKLIEAVAVDQTEAFNAGILFAQTEGIVPAPESNHAIAEAIYQARMAREEGKEKVIVFNLSGHGHFDMEAYSHFV